MKKRVKEIVRSSCFPVLSHLLQINQRSYARDRYMAGFRDGLTGEDEMKWIFSLEDGK